MTNYHENNRNYDASMRYQYNHAKRSRKLDYEKRDRFQNNNNNYSNCYQQNKYRYQGSRRNRERQQYRTYKKTYNMHYDANGFNNFYNECKINKWLSNQDETTQSILKDTIGLEFDIEFYRSGSIKNNHGWKAGHSFEAEHKKFCVPLAKNESRFVKMMILSSDYPTKEYRRRTNETKIHYKKWGQRKLLMTEIQFLSKYCELSTQLTVVYAGAAPGSSIPFLADLFPNLSFELWDPAGFHVDNFSHDRILVNNGCKHHDFRDPLLMKHNNTNAECCYFTDEIAKQYGERVRNGEKILFISDIRSADAENQNALDHEDFVLRDNELQFKWLEYINPLSAHLKFRCPYPDRFADLDNYEYLDGRLYFEPWLAPTSTEMRLVVDNSKTAPSRIKKKIYNIHKYEQQLFWWNTVARQTFINNPYYCAQIGFVHSFDCYLEAMILEQYFTKMFTFRHNNYDVLKYLIPLTVHRITKMLSPKGRNTLLTRFKRSSVYKQIDHKKFHQEMDNDKKRKEKEKTHLNALRFNNNCKQKQLKTRECIKELNDSGKKYKLIVKYLKEYLKIKDIKNLLIDKCNNMDNKIEIIKGGKLKTGKYKIFYHNNTAHFSLFISIEKAANDITNLCGCFIVDFSNDKIEIFELMENHPYSKYITQSFHLLNLDTNTTADPSIIDKTLITVILGKFIYSFDVPNAKLENTNLIIKKNGEFEDDYEFLVHDVLIFNGATNNDFESKLKICDEIVNNLNNNIGKIRNIRFVLLALYDINDIISMYAHFKYFGGLNGPIAWNSSFKINVDKIEKINEAVRGGILAKDDKIDNNSKYCKIAKCNGLAVINTSNESNLLWLNENSYSLIGLNTNLNTNPMLMATKMDGRRKSLLYDLNKENVVGICRNPQNCLTFSGKKYILVDACIKEIYLTQTNNTNAKLKPHEKEILIDAINYRLGIEYFVSYLPERRGYNISYYNKIKNNVVYEIDVIQWCLNNIANQSKYYKYTENDIYYNYYG